MAVWRLVMRHFVVSLRKTIYPRLSTGSIQEDRNIAGAQWLNGRVLDSRLRFEPHWRHCVVSLSKTHLSLLSTGSTQEDLSRHNSNIVDWDVKNQIKQIKCSLILLKRQFAE